MRDISIVPHDSSLLKLHERGTSRIHALVAPDNPRRIVMDLPVAKQRGLSFSTSPEYAVWGNIDHGQFVQTPESATQDNYSPHRLISRRAKMTDEEQQVAEVSISHEAEYAVAVCMALDEKPSDNAKVEYMVDDGTGEPLHEPIWGDAGWSEGHDSEAACRRDAD